MWAMKNNKKHTRKHKAEAAGKKALAGQKSKSLQIRYQDAPAAAVEKEIHPRQTPPPLAKGDYVPDDDPSPPLQLN